jgi:hypothetical protein
MKKTSIVLARGSHPGQDCADPERCLFEWYNWLARQQHTDDCPPGVSRVLHRFGMRLNDALPDDDRQALAVYLPNGTSPLAGTAHDGRDRTRAYIAADWAIRTALPLWLSAAGSAADAHTLEALIRIKTPRDAIQARDLIRTMQERLNAKYGPARQELSRRVREAVQNKFAAAATAAAAVDVSAADVSAADVSAADVSAADVSAAAASAVAVSAVAVSAAAAAADVAAVAAAAAAAAVAADAVYWPVRRAVETEIRKKLAPVTQEISASALNMYAVLVSGEWPTS